MPQSVTAKKTKLKKIRTEIIKEPDYEHHGLLVLDIRFEDKRRFLRNFHIELITQRALWAK